MVLKPVLCRKANTSTKRLIEPRTRQPMHEACHKKRWNSFSPTNASQTEAKIGYLKLNSETPCPPRGRDALVLEHAPRNFLAGFFHSFLDFFPCWINVPLVRGGAGRQPLITRRYKPEFYTESKNPNRTLDLITKPRLAS